ncbi:MAG: DUF1592 domain-containing protein [Verrucomicrobiales bacterium]|nr:DUF1592 domain-containing protein [Verrucomicrobiales bacterium]
MDFNEWLERQGLGKYAATFAAHGIDEVEILGDISDTELASLGIPVGARKKILRAISQGTGAASLPATNPIPEVPVPPASPHQPEAIETSPPAGQPPVTHVPWVADYPIHETPPGAPSPPPKAKRSHKGTILVTALVVLAGLVFIGVKTSAIPGVKKRPDIADLIEETALVTKPSLQPTVGPVPNDPAPSPTVAEISLEPKTEDAPVKPLHFQLVSADVATYQDHILPLLETYCHSCHGEDKVKGSVDMLPFATAESLMAERKLWLNILEQIETEEMPTKEPLPSKEERHLMVEWLHKKLNDIDWSAIRDAGHVTIPRLTNVEYQNTIRDLLGVDLSAVASFSADGEGQSGFTTDRENLFITPAAMEKYFAAAEEAVNTIADADIKPIKIKREAEDMSSAAQPGQYSNFTGRRLTIPQTTLYDVIEFPADGEYTFVIQGLSTDGPIAGVRLRINDEVKGDIVIEGNSTEPGRLTCFVTKGTHQVAWNKENSALPPNVRKRLKRGVFLGAMAVDWMAVTGPIGNTTPKQSIILSPSSVLPPDKAASQTIYTFTQRAFRRPVENEVLSRYFSIYRKATESGMNYGQSIKMALTAVLVSPKFLFRHEFAPTENIEGEFELDQFQIASRLSYFLWHSMPDRELFSLANNGKLKDPEILRAQVRRMISDPKSRSFTTEFLGQWLGFASVGIDLIPDKKVFPAFSNTLANAMKQETILTFEHLVKSDHSLLALLDTKATFLNEPLAKLYRVEGVIGPEMRPVRLTDRPNRGGLLGMASILTATSSSTRTSPVLRGKWVLETLLGEHIPEPPADAGQLPANAGHTGKTLREELEIHRDKEGCKNCHDKIDPIGFGMENFNGIGQFRTKHKGKPIDNKGELDGFTFTGVDELKRWLKAERKEAFLRNISERMLAFALGRELKTFDEGPVLEILAALEANENRAITLLEEIVLSYPFHHQNNSPSDY